MSAQEVTVKPNKVRRSLSGLKVFQRRVKLTRLMTVNDGNLDQAFKILSEKDRDLKYKTVETEWTRRKTWLKQVIGFDKAQAIIEEAVAANREIIPKGYAIYAQAMQKQDFRGAALGLRLVLDAQKRIVEIAQRARRRVCCY